MALVRHSPSRCFVEHFAGDDMFGFCLGTTWSADRPFQEVLDEFHRPYAGATIELGGVSHTLVLFTATQPSGLDAQVCATLAALVRVVDPDRHDQQAPVRLRSV